MVLCREIIQSWTESLRNSLHLSCIHLAEKLENMSQDAASLLDKSKARKASLHEGEFVRASLVDAIDQKEICVARVRTFTGHLHEDYHHLITRLNEERQGKSMCERELELLHGELEEYRSSNDSLLCSIAAQVQHAVDVKGSLQCMLLRSEAETQRLGCAEANLKDELSTLQEELITATASNKAELDVADARVQSLEEQKMAAACDLRQLERFLESVSFRSRMCSLELQRWSTPLINGKDLRASQKRCS